ncbi:MAG: tRNA pseudouridine(55) synthase TruB [Chloroflexi bacterium]|nr:tRNA pseudouridine(55) synthase TruB [Chloroflexota bacterium]
MRGPEFDGILNVNKAQGMTSHDVVARVRRLAGQRRVGHAGTLDPLATGVLLVCLGQATRVAEYLMASDKVYRARICLGICTDTYDAEGQITAEAETRGITRAAVESELQGFVGRQEQLPPMYSALKHQGTPLYRLARQGQVVDRAPRTVQFRSVELTEWNPPELTVTVHCSKGTYIRTLAHDLGQRLGCGAHLTGLTRLASGAFRLEQAVTLEDVERAFVGGAGQSLLLPLEAALSDLPAARVDVATARQIVSGQQVRLGEEAAGSLCRAYGADGQLLALLRLRDDGLWQPYKVFYRRNHDENHP